MTGFAEKSWVEGKRIERQKAEKETHSILMSYPAKPLGTIKLFDDVSAERP